MRRGLLKKWNICLYGSKLVFEIEMMQLKIYNVATQRVTEIILCFTYRPIKKQKQCPYLSHSYDFANNNSKIRVMKTITMTIWHMLRENNTTHHPICQYLVVFYPNFQWNRLKSDSSNLWRYFRKPFFYSFLTFTRYNYLKKNNNTIDVVSANVNTQMF